MEPGGPDRALSQLRRGVLEYCVLSLLTTERLYAFDLVRKLSEVEGLVTSEGTVYPLLSRLRRVGWVDTDWVESPSGPPRRYYVATAAGCEAVAAFAREWRQFRRGVDLLLGEGA
ncbi:MAG TPA: PadR family transcriptional regulator [Mycobacteriales bacterium]|nr:PadR family transcriptional regulator [Mycobacteriales bacterium]